jgi:hypothetical protein
MSNVLVIQPRRILQHATVIALFPDHEARVVNALPEAALLHECDAVIVDAVALREINALPAPALRSMDAWTVPVVWIDADTAQAPKCANIAVVKRPVSRDELRTALATCLSRQLMLRANAERPPEKGPAGSGKMIRSTTAPAPVSNPAIIELVDAIEEGVPAQTKEKK